MFDGIGDMVVVLAVTAAFAVPTMVAALIALLLMMLGFSTAALAVAGIGIATGIGCALFVRSCA